MSQRPVRVLLVEDSAADARTVSTLLTDGDSMRFQVERVSRLSVALERLDGTAVDVVLLDLTLPDSQGLETLYRVQSRAPRTPIIVVTGAGDAELARRALAGGAQDYWEKDELGPASLQRSVCYAIERHRAIASKLPETRTGMVLAFIGAKGGVGTTTVALNVAACLAKEGAGVIAVELTPWRGTFSAHLRQASPPTLRSLVDLEAECISERELASRLVSLPFGVRALFSPQHISEFGEIDPLRAEALLRAAARMARYVVVDLPAQPLESTRAAVLHSDSVTLVIDREPSSVASARIAVDWLKSWGVSPAALGAVIVNRTPLTSSPSAPEISSRVGCGIVGMIPHDPETWASTIPDVVAHPDSLPTESLAELARRLGHERDAAVVMPL